jgi:hypothetical protein
MADLLPGLAVRDLETSGARIHAPYSKRAMAIDLVGRALVPFLEGAGSAG